MERGDEPKATESQDAVMAVTKKSMERGDEPEAKESKEAVMSETKKVVLRSGDDQFFEVDELVAFQSQTVKNLVEDVGRDCPILLPNTRGKILAMVINYCKYQAELQKSADEGQTVSEAAIKLFNAEVVSIDQFELLELVLTANYLHMENLLGLACQGVADVIKSRKPEEIRTYFNIENDFSPEEEAAVRAETNWVD